jgi:hypothetical protein
VTGPTWRVFPTREQCRHAARLLDQQLWCLGRDVRHPAGNLLTGLGLCRLRSPFPAGSTRYTARTPDGGTVALWAFGVFFGDPGRGGAFVRRGGFHPVVTRDPAPPVAWAVADLPDMPRPGSAADWARVRELVRRLAGWFAHYEHWLAEAHSSAYRQRCLAAWDKPAAAPAGDTAVAWERLAKKCRHIGRYADRAGPLGLPLPPTRPTGPAARWPADPRSHLRGKR